MDIGRSVGFDSAAVPRRDDPQPGLGKAIRAFRLQARLSQDALGKKSQIHPTWISHIESGRINPTWGNVRRIADGLDVPLGELADVAQLWEADPLTTGRRTVSPPAPPPVRSPRRPPPAAGRDAAPRRKRDDPLDVESLVALRDQTNRG
jgi:transcriptional regulator with XRE-family HTH domain